MRAGANRSRRFNAAVLACRDVRRTRQPGEAGPSGLVAIGWMGFISPGGTEPKGPWHASYIRVIHFALVSYKPLRFLFHQRHPMPPLLNCRRQAPWQSREPSGPWQQPWQKPRRAFFLSGNDTLRVPRSCGLTCTLCPKHTLSP